VSQHFLSRLLFLSANRAVSRAERYSLARRQVRRTAEQMKEDAAAFDKFAAAHPDHPLTQQVLAESAKLQGDLRLSVNKRFERMVILYGNAHRLAIEAEANIPPSSPCAEKGRRLLEVFNETKALTPLTDHARREEVLERYKHLENLLTEQVELVKTMQTLRPGKPIERALKSCEALLEWNRWNQINYTDHTEETADAEKSAAENFKASELSDQEWTEFWQHVGPPATLHPPPKTSAVEVTQGKTPWKGLGIALLVAVIGMIVLGSMIQTTKQGSTWTAATPSPTAVAESAPSPEPSVRKALPVNSPQDQPKPIKRHQTKRNQTPS
jgi:hypothetical protein